MTTLRIYWELWAESDAAGHEHAPWKLTNLPTEVDEVCIAFVAPDNGIDLDLFRSSPKAKTWRFDRNPFFSHLEILNQIAKLKALRPDIKILFSLRDCAKCNWWPNVNMPLFCQAVADAVVALNLDGVDFDNESGMDQSHYVATVNALLRGLHAKMPKGKELSFICYTGSDIDKQIVTTNKNIITQLYTMNYEAGFDGIKDTLELYAGWLGDASKCGAGVLAGNSCTDLATVTQLGTWLRSTQGDNAKLSVWAAGTDRQEVSGKPDWTWCKTAAASLKAIMQLSYCPKLAAEIAGHEPSSDEAVAATDTETETEEITPTAIRATAPIKLGYCPKLAAEIAQSQPAAPAEIAAPGETEEEAPTTTSWFNNCSIQ